MVGTTMPTTRPSAEGAAEVAGRDAPEGQTTAPCSRSTSPWAASASTSRRRVTADMPSSSASSATRRLPRSRTSWSTRSWRWSTWSRMDPLGLLRRLWRWRLLSLTPLNHIDHIRSKRSHRRLCLCRVPTRPRTRGSAIHPHRTDRHDQFSQSY
ncbi:protein of unknown function [Streptomyces sp. KY75]|nr:protein of unknown function [Streptomyces sp. KY75]